MQQLAARHAHSSARLDAVSAQAATHHPAQPRPGGNPQPPPAGPAHGDPEPSAPGHWAAGEAAAGDPEVARLLANAGPAGLTVPELVAATGRQKTWV